jgi:hypothetical protein
MKFVAAILRFVSLAALLGMLIAPVSTIAAENAMATMSNAAMTEMAGMAGMADGMPCCPDEEPVKKPCDNSCPLVIICTASSVFALQRADWTSASLTWTFHQYSLAADADLQSAITEPPARPPKV